MVRRIEELITHCNVFKIIYIFIPTCLNGKYEARLREFSSK